MKDGNIDRRAFLGSMGAAAGLGLGYSLHVDASEFAPRTAEETPRSVDDIRAALEELSPEIPLDQRIAAEPHMGLVDLSCDLLVAGGGMAGVCAAIAAARNGASVLFVQDRSRLGGNASSEVRMHIVGADHHGGRQGWREGGLIEEFRLENAVHNPDYHWEMWDLMLYDKVVSEQNIRLLLDTSVCGTEVKDGRIVTVLARSDKTEHLYRISPRFCADCTGDCRLGLEAGARFRTGHESRETFGEELAPETSGEETLGSSILFTARDHGEPRRFTPPHWARKVTKEHLKHRHIGSWEYGYWWIEWGGHINAIRDNELIRFELLSIVMGVWDHIKNSGEYPDAETWAMDWIGMIPGKRSSRRLDGPHILTEQDCLSQGEPFADAVAIGGWPFDNHPPSGFDDPTLPPYHAVRIDEVYSIPLRSMFSVNIDNLFMAGRNISASHVAFTSTRVMATCAVIGQAVGAAAAWCAREDLLPKALVADSEQLEAFRQALLRDDQTIKGVGNADPLDLARGATVTASDTVPGSAPAHAVNGWVRDMPGSWSNRWGGLVDVDGAWLELAWDAPQTLREVQITFDTGFQRELTLTAQHPRQARQVRAPQPETVRDYTLEYQPENGADYEVLAEVTGNYQRLRRHRFDAVSAARLRLRIHNTNGEAEARVYEVRCYA